MGNYRQKVYRVICTVEFSLFMYVYDEVRFPHNKLDKWVSQGHFLSSFCSHHVLGFPYFTLRANPNFNLLLNLHFPYSMGFGNCVEIKHVVSQSLRYVPACAGMLMELCVLHAFQDWFGIVSAAGWKCCCSSLLFPCTYIHIHIHSAIMDPRSHMCPWGQMSSLVRASITYSFCVGVCSS